MFKLQKNIGIITKFKNTNKKLADNVNDKFTKIEKKVEGTFVEKWLKYWVTVCKDYRDVFFDVARDIRDKPTKAILIGSTGGLATYFAQHNPNSTHFRDAYIRSANEIALVHQSLVRNETLDHIEFVERCYNNDLLRHTNLGIISFMWIDNYSDKCSKFETNCSYLQLSYIDIYNRIVDIGFLDTWWVLAKKMTDYDVNYI